jgi:hypothetical protein
MTTKDPVPHAYDPELVDACKDLYDVMSYPFEREFSSFGYSLEFTGKPDQHATLYLAGGVKDTLEKELGLTFDRDGAWRMLFHHDEVSDRLRADTVAIPFVDSDRQRQSLIFKHFPKIGYIVLAANESGDMTQWLSEDQRLEKDVFGQSTSPIVSAETIAELLDEAGFPLDLPNTPESRYAIAKNLDDIDNWLRRERIVVPVAPNLQVIMKKESVHFAMGELRDSGGSITAIAEEVYPNGRRDQLVITLPIDGAIVEAPEVVTQKLRPSDDPGDIATYGSNAYRVEDRTHIPLTAELANRLSADLREDLGTIS